MNKQEMLKEIEALKLKVEAYEDKPKKWARWKPEIDGLYWIVSQAGQIEELPWCNDDTDKHLYSQNLVFKTEEEAELKSKKIIIQQQLEDLSRELWAESGEVCDWEDYTTTKVFIHFSIKKLNISSNITCKDLNVYFPDETCLEKAIARIGEDKLKILFGVE